MTTASDEKNISEKPPEPMQWIDFLQGHPPGSVVNVEQALERGEYQTVKTSAPELQLFCPEDTCNANMFFTSKDTIGYLDIGKFKFGYVTYQCCNCRNYTKTFALAIQAIDTNKARAYKFGELPHFGPPVPPRVLRRPCQIFS